MRVRDFANHRAALFLSLVVVVSLQRSLTSTWRTASTTTYLRRHLSFFLDPRSVSDKDYNFEGIREKRDSSESQYELPVRSNEDLLLLVLNTAKCGTGTLATTFSSSFACENDDQNSDKFSKNFKCPQNTRIIQSHSLERSVDLVKNFLENEKQKQCVVVTAHRNPRSWFPSLFMQQLIGDRKAHCPYEEDVDFENYRKWLVSTELKKYLEKDWVMPKLLEFYGENDMGEVVRKTYETGYMRLDNGPEYGVFSKCELVVLNMDQVSKWPKILSTMFPKLKFAPVESRKDLCPNLASKYQILKNYQLSGAERRHLFEEEPQLKRIISFYEAESRRH
mmetsp:Transcript_30016/g.45940  ORF Transcript_30016/g.45940 Transcript_30016/m.45940 type:complete len:335 (+) Transcript_30016:26-1030(+)